MLKHHPSLDFYFLKGVVMARRVSFAALKRVVQKFDNTMVTVKVPRIALLTGAQLEQEGAPYDYKDGEPIKKSLFKFTEVYLPLSMVIQIYNQGYTVKVPSKKGLKIVVENVSKLLDELEANLTPENEELFELINDFYNGIIEGREKEIEELFELSRKRELEQSGSILALSGNLLSKDVSPTDSVTIKRSDGKIINIGSLDDLEF